MPRMIGFSRDGSQVKVHVTPRDSFNPLHACLGDMPNELTAQLVADSLARHLQNALEAKAELCYEAGWSDAKAHRRKCKEFFGNFDTDPATGVSPDRRV